MGTIRTWARRIRTDWRDHWSPFERWWLLLFSLTNLLLFFALDDTWIGLLASLTGMMSVILVAKRRISNYYYGIINILLYAWLSWHQQYYGEVMLNLLYYFPTQFIGLFLWRRHRTAPQSGEVRIRWLTNRERVLWGTVAILGTVAYGWFLARISGALPYTDSFTTILSIVATVLMLQRVPEQWILWILVDIATIAMWVRALETGGGISMVVMWSAYLVNAVYGLVVWWRGAPQRGEVAA